MNVLRVFVASPDDVLDARQVLGEVINELNDTWEPQTGLSLRMLDWRRHITPYLDKSPQTTLIEQLAVESWDLFIGILWSKYGTPIQEINPDTKKNYRSGTEHEFDLAYKCFKVRGSPKILFYRCRVSVDPDTDPTQLSLIQEFFQQFQLHGQHHGLYDSYDSLEGFRRKIYRHLTTALIARQQGNVSSAPTPNLGSNLGKWLENIGLTGNPFSNSNAGSDSYLPQYYYYWKMPYFNEIVGNTQNVPMSAVVFGERGMGKTAIRRMVAHYSAQRLGGRNVLAISYTDFSRLYEKLTSGGTISPRDHVEQILQSGMRTLSLAIENGSAKLKNGIADESLREFLSYFYNFGYNLSESQRKVVTDSIQIKLQDRIELPNSYIELFYGFCRLVRIFNYDIVYTLVDQLDESSQADDDKIISLLLPLMADLQLMEPPDNLAIFRFFLPTHLEAYLKG